MRILIVEDEETLANALQKSLEKSGYASDYVTDGDKAMQRISLYRNEYDLIVLDLMMPGMTGFEVCKEVRAQGITTPILVLTGKDMVKDKVKLLRAGADDYMVKPFTIEELTARVDALLRRPHESLPVTLEVDNIKLDTSTHRAFLGKQELRLTTKEYSLLEYFMRHPGQVLDREKILDHLWGFGFDSFSNVVDVHIKNLRRKLDGRRKRPIIETVRGVGYRLRTKE